MSTVFCTPRRTLRQPADVECTVLDAPAGPRFSIGWSPDDTTIFDVPSEARAAMARSRRVREELFAAGHGDIP